ncbi:MAG: GIY-YIG nuclease family protein [Patescibacteria group bacterium]
MSKIQITWSKLIPLRDEDIKKIDAIGGVYRISKKAEDGNFYVFYVGSAENIKEKLEQHLSESETNPRLKDLLKLGGDFVFRYAVVTDESIQKAIEKQMYNTYLPEANLERPKSTLEMDANLN